MSGEVPEAVWMYKANVSGLCDIEITENISSAWQVLKKLRKHGTGGKLLRTNGDWLRNRWQRVCIKGKQPTWKYGVVFLMALFWGLCHS